MQKRNDEDTIEVSCIRHALNDTNIEKELLLLDPTPTQHDLIVRYDDEKRPDIDPIIFPVTKYIITKESYLFLTIKYPEFKEHTYGGRLPEAESHTEVPKL